MKWNLYGLWQMLTNFNKTLFVPSLTFWNVYFARREETLQCMAVSVPLYVICFPSSALLLVPVCVCVWHGSLSWLVTSSNTAAPACNHHNRLASPHQLSSIKTLPDRCLSLCDTVHYRGTVCFLFIIPSRPVANVLLLVFQNHLFNLPAPLPQLQCFLILWHTANLSPSSPLFLICLFSQNSSIYNHQLP